MTTNRRRPQADPPAQAAASPSARGSRGLHNYDVYAPRYYGVSFVLMSCECVFVFGKQKSNALKRLYYTLLIRRHGSRTRLTLVVLMINDYCTSRVTQSQRMSCVLKAS